MLLLVRRWWPEREIVAVADSGYSSLKLLTSCRCFLPKSVTFVTRLRLDAALYEPAAPRKPKQIGRPRLKGKRLTTLAAVANNPGTTWTPVVIANWYGKGERTVEVTSATAVWYHTGLAPVHLRWVLVRDPQEEFAPQALLCRALTAEPAQILSWFVLRWQMEGDLPRSAAAPRGRDAATVVRSSHKADDARAFGPVLAGDALRPSANGAGLGGTWAGSMVPQTPTDLLRCFGAGTARVMGAEDFLGVDPRSGYGKSPAGVSGTLNRDALLCRVNG